MTSRVTVWPICGAGCGPPTRPVLDRRLDALVGSVCRDDPRTLRQRRADAVGTLWLLVQALGVV